MILYNVTIKIDRRVHDEWLAWMKDMHLPAVMATGFFLRHRMLRLMDPPSDEDGITYAVQYECSNIGLLRRYFEEEAPALQRDHAQRYNGRFVAFRTIMKTVD
ncbi:MAG: hypothetical protein RLY31_1239 [Bacteroidota bacterium]|jgi:hypothetical protein